MKSGKNYEIEFFIRKTNASAGNIVNMLDDSDNNKFTISTDANNKIAVTCATMSIAGTSDAALTLNTWTHVRVRISNGNAYIYVNGVLSYSGTCSLEVQNITKIRLGGFIGQLDEFMIRHALSNDNVPGVPYKGYIDTYGIGGTGKQGALNLTTGTNKINTYYYANTIIDSQTFRVHAMGSSNAYIGMHGDAQPGDEVMIWKEQLSSAGKLEGTESGLYAFRKIKSVTGTQFTLDSPVTEFSMTPEDTQKYYFLVSMDIFGLYFV